VKPTVASTASAALSLRLLNSQTLAVGNEGTFETVSNAMFFLVLLISSACALDVEQITAAASMHFEHQQYEEV
jgi:hypothetical protein